MGTAATPTDPAGETPPKHSRLGDHRVISRWWIGGGIIGVGLFFLAALFGQVVWAANNFDEPSPSDSIDAIVVMGAAQWNGDPSPIFEGRLLRALELYRDDVSRVIVTTGASQPGDRVTQGFAGYEYLRNQGVPDEAILVITDGTNTWEELTATERVLADRGLNAVALVSDPYHNYRLLQMAEDVGLRAWVAPTDLDPTIRNYVRETGASAAGIVLGWRRVSNLR